MIKRDNEGCHSAQLRRPCIYDSGRPISVTFRSRSAKLRDILRSNNVGLHRAAVNLVCDSKEYHIASLEVLVRTGY